MLVADLASRGLLVRHVPTNTPIRIAGAATPLIYYAQPSWFIRTTARQQELLDQNEATSWFPPTIQWGRYGNWLRNNIDWALSRDRYWGTPAPCGAVRRAPHGDRIVGGAVRVRRPGRVRTRSHRPFVDDVTLPCPPAG